MTAAGQSEKLRLGFLTALETPGQGFVGGLLVTNHLGRPLEFQCTSPVKPNRTQVLLYGPTLESYLLAELIGKTLVEKAGVKPHVVMVAQEHLLDLREHVSMPVAWVLPPGEKSTESDISIGRQSVRVHGDHLSDCTTLAKKMQLLPENADLSEPFERVQEALRETAGGAAA